MSEPWLARVLFGVLGLLLGAIFPLALADSARFIKGRPRTVRTVLLVPLRFIAALVALGLGVGVVELGIFWIVGFSLPDPPEIEGGLSAALGAEGRRAADAEVELLLSFMREAGAEGWMAVGTIVGLVGGLLLVWIGIRRGMQASSES